jgi:hypothetical protein
VTLFGSVQSLIELGLEVALTLLTGWAFVSAVRTPTEAFPYAGKRTKGFWLAITGVAFAIGLLAPPPFNLGALNLFALLAAVGGLVYLTDVRPAVAQYRPGRSSSAGPYGPW